MKKFAARSTTVQQVAVATMLLEKKKAMTYRRVDGQTGNEC
jgi:hypothetical protein